MITLQPLGIMISKLLSLSPLMLKSFSQSTHARASSKQGTPSGLVALVLWVPNLIFNNVVCLVEVKIGVIEKK